MPADRTLHQARSRAAAGAIVSCLSIAAAGAQTGFEDAELVGWSTEVSGFVDRSVSGAAEASGGNPGAHHLVRHTHELFDSFPTTVVSVSFSPVALDPAELGLSGVVRFLADLRFEVTTGSPPLFAPTLYWTPALEQGGVLYRYANPGNVTFGTRDVFVHVEADLEPENWVAIAGAADPDFSSSAAPARIGLLVQSDVPVRIEEQGEARIRIDNVRLEPFAPPPPPGTADIAVAVCGTEVAEAAYPSAKYTATVRNRGPETATGVVLRVVPPPLADSRCSSDSCQIGTLLPGEETTVALSFIGPGRVPTVLRTDVSGDLPDANPSNNSASMATTEVDCTRLDNVGCPVLASLAEEICEARLPRSSCPASAGEPAGLWVRAGAALARVVSSPARRLLGALVDLDLDVFYRLREEVLRTTPTGRRAIELYETHGPEITGLVLSDASFRERGLAALGMWQENLRALVDGRGEEVSITAPQIAAIEGVLDDLAGLAGPELQAVVQRERELLDLPSFVGLNMAEAQAQAQQPGCAEAETALCLGGGRFRATASWRDSAGNTGVGRAISLTEDTGTFWFFEPENVELVVKVLDGRALNDRFWVFYGALSDVEYTLEVEDTVTGAVQSYQNPLGNLASVADTSAFAGGGDAPAALPAPPPLPSSCAPEGTRLCLNGGRFEVEVSWRDFDGGSGAGRAVDLTSDTGTFWFFGPENVEVIVKVLDGRLINGRFWVFYGALSNVEYTITVRDRNTDRVQTYTNPSGHFASFADVDAF